MCRSASGATGGTSIRMRSKRVRSVSSTRRIAADPSSSAGMARRRAGGQHRQVVLGQRRPAPDRARRRPSARRRGPGPSARPNRRCTDGRRRSASMSSTRCWNSCAIVSARLAAVRLLPSPLFGLVMAMARSARPLSARLMRVRSERYCSAASDVGASAATRWDRGRDDRAAAPSSRRRPAADGGSSVRPGVSAGGRRSPDCRCRRGRRRRRGRRGDRRRVRRLDGCGPRAAPRRHRSRRRCRVDEPASRHRPRPPGATRTRRSVRACAVRCRRARPCSECPECGS